MKILVVDDEIEIAELTADMLQVHGHKVDVATNAADAEDRIHSTIYDLVFSDIFMSPKSGIHLLEDLKNSNTACPPFIFISGGSDHDVLEKASRISGVHVILKPFSADSLVQAIQIVMQRKTDRILDIMHMMTMVSGVVFGDDKRSLIETRLQRRARRLGLESLDEYYSFFLANRDSEMSEVISHLTTHHTFFFRELEHFEFLEKSIFPKLVLENKKRIRIWSAACSSGEELYSIGAIWLRFIARSKIPKEHWPKLELVGTDIDLHTVEKAKKGIYERNMIKDVPADLVALMFDFGTGDLANYVRIKDELHSMCRFKRHNLHSNSSPFEPFDCVFLRNVLIYFTPTGVQSVIQNVLPGVSDNGWLILGQSESIGTTSSLRHLGQSIFEKSDQPRRAPVSSHNQTMNTKTNSPGHIHPEMTKVYIIDDSATIRTGLKKVFSLESGFEVVGESESGVDAFNQISKLKPDVVTLDIHMPGMDGIAYLSSVQGKDHPPIVMISSVSAEDAISAMKCFELGAVDYIQKPGGHDLAARSDEMRSIIKSARKKSSASKPKRKLDLRASKVIHASHTNNELLLIGASTGGVEALRVVLTQFPKNAPPTLIVQHIPPVFSKAMADRFDKLCEVRVKEAENGEVLEYGSVYIAPGGIQMGVEKFGKSLRITLVDAPPENRHKPSVDYLFSSVVRSRTDKKIVASILTGMGNDGAQGLLQLKKYGAHTIAQDEESCVVYGMPKVAVELGAAIEIAPLPSISYHMFQALKVKNVA